MNNYNPGFFIKCFVYFRNAEKVNQLITEVSKSSRMQVATTALVASEESEKLYFKIFSHFPANYQIFEITIIKTYYFIHACKYGLFFYFHFT